MEIEGHHATQLACILSDAGQTEEAQIWRAKAEACYDEMLARHPEAFADYAAEFWLTIGGDPERALRLARQNLALRQTPAPANSSAAPRASIDKDRKVSCRMRS